MSPTRLTPQQQQQQPSCSRNCKQTRQTRGRPQQPRQTFRPSSRQVLDLHAEHCHRIQNQPQVELLTLIKRVVHKWLHKFFYMYRSPFPTSRLLLLSIKYWCHKTIDPLSPKVLTLVMKELKWCWLLNPASLIKTSVESVDRSWQSSSQRRRLSLAPPPTTSGRNRKWRKRFRD